METDRQIVESSEQKKQRIRHAALMGACIILPLALMGVLWAAGITGRWIWIAVILIHPLIHFGMMGGKHSKAK